MQTSIIYTETVKALRYGYRRVIHQGGQYSGKTVNILGALATLCAEETNGGVTTVTAQSFPHLKGGALRDFESYVYPTFKNAIKSYHKTDHLFTFKSGSLMEFKVFENEMAARGQKRKRLFVNEANSFDYPVWFQLDSRSEQSIIDYNPSVRFWSHDKLQGQPGNKFFRSWHEHNPFLTKQKHDEIESLYDFVTQKGDLELWKVYARGLTGNVTGVIFPNWVMIDESEFPKDEEFFYAVDFGYTNDPTAVMMMCVIGKTLFVKELLYETGAPAVSIKNILAANKFDFGTSVLYCEHDPHMIKQLRKHGVRCQPAHKGQGSVNAGIELLRQYEVKYTNKSENLHKERSLYVWEKDELGKTTNIPVDNNNHTFDAIRYGFYTKYLRKRGASS